MSILGFKDWFNEKEKHPSINKGKDLVAKKIGMNLYELNSKVLTLHLDEHGSDIIKSGHKVKRWLIDEDHISQDSLDEIKMFINNELNGKESIFLVGYDMSSDDSKKTWKSSKRLVEEFKSQLGIESLATRAFGNIERLNDIIPGNPRNFNKTRIELWKIDLSENAIYESEIPIIWNPNNYELIDKYKISLRGLLYRLILAEGKGTIKIACGKSIPSSRKIPLNESFIREENSRAISILKYSLPNKISHLDPDNKPSATNERITIQSLTEKRADSVCGFLNKWSSNYGINWIAEGLGIREGASAISIHFSEDI